MTCTRRTAWGVYTWTIKSPSPVTSDVIADRKDSTLERRRVLSRLQFSLRTVLAVISLAAICFTCLLRQEAARRQLITDIEDVGGSVKFDESTTLSLFKSQRVAEVILPHGRIADVGPLRLKSFPNLSTLELKGVDATNHDGLRFHCSELWWTMITDDMLKQLESQAITLCQLQKRQSAAGLFRSNGVD